MAHVCAASSGRVKRKRQLAVPQLVDSYGASETVDSKLEAQEVV